MNNLSLFAGIDGLGLGLERAGMTTVGQVELDPYCRQILAQQWPTVPQHDDVRTAPAWWASEERPAVELVSGGWPCQPFSNLGGRLGIADERYGWPWFADVVRAVRPSWVLMENVPALLGNRVAFGRVLSDLAELGFDAEWSVLSACAVGAPHTRERLFVLAHRSGVDGEQSMHLSAAMEAGRASARAASGNARADRWLPEPDVGRVAHGLPKRMVAPQLHAVGNAVVPAVAEHIGRVILAADKYMQVSG